MDSSLHDIVQGIMIAGIHADRMAERWPHHANTLVNFHEEVNALRAKLIRQLAREGLYGREPYDWDGEGALTDNADPPSGSGPR